MNQFTNHVWCFEARVRKLNSATATAKHFVCPKVKHLMWVKYAQEVLIWQTSHFDANEWRSEYRSTETTNRKHFAPLFNEWNYPVFHCSTSVMLWIFDLPAYCVRIAREFGIFFVIESWHFTDAVRTCSRYIRN